MKVGYVSFDYNAAGGLNVTSNPLPNHPGPKINALTEDSTESVKTRVTNVKTPIEKVYKALIQAKIFYSEETEMIKREDQDGTLCNQYYQYHANMVGHTIQDCVEFRKMVQDLIDIKEIEFSSRGEHSINVITSTSYSRNPSPNGPRPITFSMTICP